MAEYIDRETFIEDIKTEIVNLSMDGLKGTMMPHDELYGFIERIKEQPAADVAQVVHGEWMRHRNKLWHYCSVCLEDALMSKSTGTEVLSCTCPHCGAKMEESDLDGRRVVLPCKNRDMMTIQDVIELLEVTKHCDVDSVQQIKAIDFAISLLKGNKKEEN